MIKNYLKIALRYFRKNAGYSVLNISGLAIGMAGCVLIMLYVINELGFDKHHHLADRIFRVKYHLNLGGVDYDEASIPFPAAEAFRNDFPEVQHAVRLYRNDDFPMLQVGEHKFIEERFFFVDASVFEVFDFPLLKGDPRTALREHNSVILSEDVAHKYFGNEDPIGQTLLYESRHSLKVTGVAHNVPTQSHFRFDFLAPLEFQLGIWESQTGLEGREKKWFWSGAWTYLLLSNPAGANTLAAKMPQFVDKYFPDRIKRGAELSLQPLADIHLHSRLDNELAPNSHVLYIYIFSAIAFLILVIACINFVNLSTAQAANRSKEVGVRKVIGASKPQLVLQLLGEAIIASLAAISLALVTVELLLPVFNHLTERQLVMASLGWEGILAILGMALLVGILSGIYPAFFMSGFNPISIFKRSVHVSGDNDFFRRTLVVTQFAIATMLIIGIGVVHQQLNFIREKELGFEKEQVLFVKARPEVNQKFESFRNELMRDPGIRAVAGTSNIPGQGVFAYRFIPEGTPPDKPLMLPLLLVDHDFLETMGIGVMQGRGFSRSSPSDQAEGFILNEKAVEEFGWKDNPIGRKMALFAPGTSEIGKTGFVIGVIKNYHFESLHHEVKPLVLTYFTEHSYYAIKLGPGDLAQRLAHVEGAWNKLSPEWPFECFFLDRKLEQLYGSEQKLAQVINYFTIIAVVVACLGLFGLSAIAAQRRTKEIGIRKVLGASIASITSLLSADFTKLVLIANLIAWPVGWYVMNRWLQNFAYRVEPGLGVFLLAGLIAFAISWLTVSYQAIKAALANPVEALRYE